MKNKVLIAGLIAIGLVILEITLKLLISFP
jgi:hypothetical protein